MHPDLADRSSGDPLQLRKAHLGFQPDVSYKIRRRTDAVFTVSEEGNRRDFALGFFDELSARNETNGGSPPLGLHTLTGAGTPLKIQKHDREYRGGTNRTV